MLFVEFITKGNAMELIVLLLIVLAINVVGVRWGVDSRDGNDWCAG